jgi:transcriptional antiterminator
VKTDRCNILEEQCNINEELIALKRIVKDVNDYLVTPLSKRANNFEKKRTELIISVFKDIYDLYDLLLNLFIKFKNSKSIKNFKRRVDIIIADRIARIKSYLKEPFSHFLDASIWMLFNDQPVGVCNIKAEDIIWSPDEDKRGLVSAKKFYTNVKSLNSKDFNHPERENVARIRIFINLVHKSELENFLENKLAVEEFGKENWDVEKRLVFTNGFPPEIHPKGLQTF